MYLETNCTEASTALIFGEDQHPKCLLIRDPVLSNNPFCFLTR